MAVGQPGHPAPKAALTAAQAALVEGRIGYTDALGSVPCARGLPMIIATVMASMSMPVAS